MSKPPEEAGDKLLEELGSTARINPNALKDLKGSPLDQAELISSRLGDALTAAIAGIVEHARKVSLSQYVLVGLRPSEVVPVDYHEPNKDALEAPYTPNGFEHAERDTAPPVSWGRGIECHDRVNQPIG
ncbi:hypothetical protein [Gordonia metallireducens]|uniref:hypothetical protein n=1 Tax=Gordonia metallireducens TaxID=2897779 RepID=UPI001E327954|nr:hypothetical protein [Gordonia metallireducens]